VRRAVRLLLAAVTVGGILFLFVLPGREWLGQSRATSAAKQRLTILSQENAALAKRAQQLQSTAYIEQLARQQYGLIMPGEQAYGIEPPAATTTTTSPAGG
jgi:Septum formation initiator